MHADEEAGLLELIGLLSGVLIRPQRTPPCEAALSRLT
jgi:hypothetical protein